MHAQKMNCYTMFAFSSLMNNKMCVNKTENSNSTEKHIVYLLNMNPTDSVEYQLFLRFPHLKPAFSHLSICDHDAIHKFVAYTTT